ncbi:dihydrofolate reductase family protein [Blastococcus goldschmidtiae]|uniref:Dihydrofolate reductase family protein n=1 Tax=Blastococcus goldschmidtiae TaxID=3075546 RepID=A0ABU2K4F4_9ACTN|nr:dihydrofolate reductase family protein [Blastococcus sp. DSM 46792]MDT0275077.1 dihydrofolate reductase family protein [Blastococcus sp. DSM 46792]
MRKIVFHLGVSLDGYFEGPDADLSWHRVDEELHTYFNRQLAASSAFLEGRVTYELMEAYWPDADKDPDADPATVEFAGIWRSMPKIVYSRTLDTPGPNATVVRDVVPQEVRALQAQPGGEMVVGGPVLAEVFRRHDLIDEYRIFVMPVLVGRGRRLFESEGMPADLRLAETRTFGNGVVMLRYERDR